MAKRLFDIVMSLLMLILSSPLYFVAAVIVKLGSRGPVHHHAIRVGKGNKPFHLYKFRTMVVNAAKKGPGITSAHDPRITKVGRFLRKTKLDEIPQLWNVLKGDMSIIGPRPEDPKYVCFYTQEQQRVLSVRPGLSSPAAIQYRHEESILTQSGGNVEDYYLKHILPDKLKLDLEYIDSRSIWVDFKLCLKTAKTILKMSSAEPIESRSHGKPSIQAAKQPK
jgi:lipopolysaccharide/colanic/teichoic acid biosynthesis glycosyltransferase